MALIARIGGKWGLVGNGVWAESPDNLITNWNVSGR